MNYCVVWLVVVIFLQSISSISYSVYYINPICITSFSIFAKFIVLFAFVWKRIRRNVNALAQNQQKITHVLQESLSILNVSRIEIAENRKSVNELLFMIFTIIFNEIIFNLDRHVAMIQSLKDCLVWLLKLDFILNIYKCSSTSWQ